jgi:uncharacterized protein YggT (Ycf19 family)
MSPILQYWYFHLPNFVLAAAMYTVLGRLLLSLFVNENWGNYIWRAFVRLTDPFVKVVRVITPASVPALLVLIFTFLWLMLARALLYVLLARLNLLPVQGN